MAVEKDESNAGAPELSAEETHARSLMSPEELEALESVLDDEADAGSEDDDEDDEDDDEVVIVDHKKAGADEGDGAADGAADGDAAGEGQADADAQAGEDEGEGEGEGADEAGSFAPQKPSYTLPDDHQARRDALETGFSELERKFEEGDLTRAEYAAENRKLMREQSELDRQEVRAEAARDAFQAQVSAVWKAAFDKYVAWAASPEGGGLKYGTEQKPNEHLRAMLGAEADKIAMENPGLSPAAVWRKADAAVRENLGLPAPAPAQAKPSADSEAKAKAAKAEKAKARAQDKAQVPKNLGGVTGEATESDVSGNEFAYLDKLKGEAYEAAFAKLSPAKREAYMAMP